MANESLFVTIYKKLLADIQRGVYQENSPLPSEDKLCKTYNVSRSTVRRALDLLKATGIIETVNGTGSYIKPRLFTQPLSGFYSFTDMLKSVDIIIQNRVISCNLVEADAALEHETGYPIGTRFHRLVRLRSAREYPLMLEVTYLPRARFLSLDTDILSNGSLYEFLRDRYGFHADRAVEKFQPVMPRLEEKTLLHILSDIPCTLLERYSYEGDMLIEYTKSIVRGDKYAFRVDLPLVTPEKSPA